MEGRRESRVSKAMSTFVRESRMFNTRGQQSVGTWSYYGNYDDYSDYDEDPIIQAPVKKKNKKKMVLKHIKPLLMKWFRDTRPILEHAMYIRVEDISVSVSHNISGKKKRKEYQRKISSSRMSFGGRRSLWDVRPSFFYDEREREPVLETKKRVSFFNKAIDRYYQDQNKLSKPEPEHVEMKTAGELDNELYQLDRLMKSPISLEDDNTTNTISKKTKVRFKENAPVSLYQTLLGGMKAGNNPKEKQNSKQTDPNSKENVGTKKKAKAAGVPNKMGDKSEKNTKSVLKLQSQNANNASGLITTGHSHTYPTIMKKQYSTKNVNQNADTDLDTVMTAQTGQPSWKRIKTRLIDEIALVNLEIEVTKEENQDLQEMVLKTRHDLQHRHRGHQGYVHSARNSETDELSLYSILIYILACVIGIIITKLTTPTSYGSFDS